MDEGQVMMGAHAEVLEAAAAAADDIGDAHGPDGLASLWHVRGGWALAKLGRAREAG